MERGPKSSWDELITDSIAEEYVDAALTDIKEFLPDWWDRYQEAIQVGSFTTHVELDAELVRAGHNLEEMLINMGLMGRQQLELTLGPDEVEARRLKQIAEDDFYPDDEVALPGRSRLILTYSGWHQTSHASDMPAEKDYYSFKQLYVGSRENGRAIPIFKMARALAADGDLQAVEISPTWFPDYFTPEQP